MSDSELSPQGGDQVPRTWGDHLESSLLTGTLVTTAWMLVVLITGGWPVDTTENLSGLLNAALNNVLNISALTFLLQAIWFRRRRPSSGGVGRFR